MNPPVPPPGPQPAPPALEVAGVRKIFGEYTAVHSTEVVVNPGSFHGLVGPNGAGKTTLLSMAVGLLRPDAGTARVHGVDVWDEPERAKQLMGVLPDGLALPEHLTGHELLTYLGRLRGMAPDVLRTRAAELLSVLELGGDAERTLLIDYSTGMRKKIGLATALLHRPSLLVLDEPFEAVDPVSTAMLKRALNRYVAAGGSVLLSSHVMPLVEQLCDTVTIMASGKVVAAGPLTRVCAGRPLEEVFVELVGSRPGKEEGLAWLAP